MSSSRPKTSLPVTGNLATEIFFGPSRAGDLRVARRESAAEHLLQALMSDSTPGVDSTHYRRYRPSEVRLDSENAALGLSREAV